MLESEQTPVETTTDIQRVREVSQQAALNSGLPSGDDGDKSELVVVAAGGDGTLALVAQNTPPGTVLVPMPLGTENLLSRHFGFTREPAQVRDTIWHGVNKLLDVGLANGRMFLVMVTCGFDAEVVRAMHLTRQGHINRFSYFGPIMRALKRYRFPPLTIEWLDDFREPEAAREQTTTDQAYRWAMCFNLPVTLHRCGSRRWPRATMANLISAGCIVAVYGTACAIWAELLWVVILNGVMSLGARSLVVESHRLRRSRTRSMEIMEASCRLKSKSCRTI